MAEVEFYYKQDIIKIQCNREDKMKDTIQKFANKISKIHDDLCMLYDGNKINEELTFFEIANIEDKKRNKMKILIYDIEKENPQANKKLEFSKNIICPKCKEDALLNYNEYKFNLSSCKNEHKIENILLNEFENTQMIDESTIKCESCEKDKSIIFENKFNRCLSCKMNLCPLCSSSHINKKHNIIDYDNKNYICELHYELYNSYCQNCKKDICVICEKDHNKHEIIYYGSIIPDVNKMKNNFKELRNKIEEYKNFILEVINKLNSVMENLDIYYKINNDILSKFEMKNRNYLILQNMNNINISIYNCIEDINNIINCKSIDKSIINTINLYNKIKGPDAKKFKKKEEDEEIIEEEKKENEKVDKDTIEEVEKQEKIEDESKIISELKKEEQKKEIIKENNDSLLNINKLEGIFRKDSDQDNNYTNFKINEIEKMLDYKIENDFKFIKVLPDGKILSYNSLDYEIDNEKYYINEIYVHDIWDNKVNKLEFNYNGYIEDMIVMNDGNIILKGKSQIHVIKIKEKVIENIQIIELEVKKIYLFSDDIIALYDYFKDKLLYYQYEQGLLIDTENKTYIKGSIYEICEINSKQIVVYGYEDGKIYGWNDFLYFYDRIYNNKIDTIKIGDGEGNDKSLRKINDCYIILQHKSKYFLVDIIKRKIKEKISLYTNNLSSLIKINDDKFLIQYNSDEICQYRINNEKKPEYECSKSVESFQSFMKYPGNKIIVLRNENVSIYG